MDRFSGERVPIVRRAGVGTQAREMSQEHCERLIALASGTAPYSRRTSRPRCTIFLNFLASRPPLGASDRKLVISSVATELLECPQYSTTLRHCADAAEIAAELSGHAKARRTTSVYRTQPRKLETFYVGGTGTRHPFRCLSGCDPKFSASTVPSGDQSHILYWGRSCRLPENFSRDRPEAGRKTPLPPTL
jgi:hypothetical protein